MKAILIAAALGLTGVSAAWAEGQALVVGNLVGSAAGTSTSAVPALQGLGFTVAADSNMTSTELRGALSRLNGAAGDAGRMVILLEGSFVHAGAENWFLGSEALATMPPPDLATVGGVAVNLATVLQIAGQAPGGALVLLGGDDRRMILGPGLTPGVGDLTIPPGVTVIRGGAGPIGAFVAGDLAHAGQSLATLAARHPELSAEGFLSPLVPFVPAGSVAPADTSAAEAAAWATAQAAGTPEALQSFLGRFPAGAHASAARTQLAQALANPFLAEERAEEALNLSRDQRREVQRGLSLLGFDPRGIDGIFGPGTRSAVRSWQAAQGAANPSGYLDATDLGHLQAQADRRAAQLQAEADARRAAEDRQDRAYWAQTGGQGDEAGLRAYLNRYPDGLYADAAQGRLDQIDARREAAAQRQDREAWQRATHADTVAAYRAYLSQFPRGAFADAARTRIRHLGDSGNSAEREAQAAEAALNLNLFTRKLAEERLAALNLDPGRVDGVFDTRTRRAIRRFQRASNLPATGYLNQATLVRLLASALKK